MKVPSKCWIAGMNAMGSADFESTLGDITAPVLVIYGDHDIFPWESDVGGQEALVLGLPAITLVKLQEVGHASHWEAPSVVAGHIEAWLSTI
jgi:pimeloyl-ACP methyl ester carboxylesterase